MDISSILTENCLAQQTSLVNVSLSSHICYFICLLPDPPKPRNQLEMQYALSKSAIDILGQLMVTGSELPFQRLTGVIPCELNVAVRAEGTWAQLHTNPHLTPSREEALPPAKLPIGTNRHQRAGSTTTNETQTQQAKLQTHLSPQWTNPNTR